MIFNDLFGFWNLNLPRKSTCIYSDMNKQDAQNTKEFTSDKAIHYACVLLLYRYLVMRNNCHKHLLHWRISVSFARDFKN